MFVKIFVLLRNLIINIYIFEIQLFVERDEMWRIIEMWANLNLLHLHKKKSIRLVKLNENMFFPFSFIKHTHTHQKQQEIDTSLCVSVYYLNFPKSGHKYKYHIFFYIISQKKTTFFLL